MRRCCLHSRPDGEVVRRLAELLLGDAADDLECFVEIALDGDDLCAIHHRLRQFAEGDLAFRDDDDGVEPRS